MPQPKPKPAAKGLVLELGGAPVTPHWLPGVPGLFVPGVPTVVGGPGEVTDQHAAELDTDPAVPLRLVEVADGEVAGLREQARRHHRENRGGIVAARRAARGLEGQHAKDAAEQHTTTGNGS
jgi:hypothetical protein